MNTWFVYIARCADASLYTGITKDLQRRIKEHNSDRLGAKYTKVRRPVILVYYEESHSRSTASKREYEIKKLSREEKERILADLADSGALSRI